jgi:hypothetical protein
MKYYAEYTHKIRRQDSVAMLFKYVVTIPFSRSSNFYVNETALYSILYHVKDKEGTSVIALRNKEI